MSVQSNHVLASSASGRVEAGRAAMAWGDEPSDMRAAYAEVRAALAALATPAGTLESPEDIAVGVMAAFTVIGGDVEERSVAFIRAQIIAAVHAGIQAAWESWEPDDYAHEYGE